MLPLPTYHRFQLRPWIKFARFMSKTSDSRCISTGRNTNSPEARSPLLRPGLFPQNQNVCLATANQCHTFLSDSHHTKFTNFIALEHRFSTNDSRGPFWVIYNRL